VFKASEYGTKNSESKNSANSHFSKEMELPNPDNFGLKAFTHRKSQNILTVSQIKFANKLLNQDNLQYKIQVSEQDLVNQFFEYKKTKSV
jgi:hypothetical protein